MGMNSGAAEATSGDAGASGSGGADWENANAGATTGDWENDAAGGSNDWEKTNAAPAVSAGAW